VSLTVVGLQSILIEQVNSSLLGRQYGVALLLVIFISGYGLAFLTISRSRSDKPLSINFYEKLGFERWYKNTAFYHNKLKVPSFLNMNQALHWYEWRKFGWIMPSMVIFLGSFVVLSAFFTENITALAPFSLALLIMIPFFGPEVASTGFGKYDYKLPEFIKHLPVSDYQIAKSMLILLFRSHSISYGLMALVFILTIVVSGSFDSLASNINSINIQYGTYQVNVGILLALMLILALGWMLSTNLMALFLRMSNASKMIKHVVVPLIMLGSFILIMEGFEQLSKEQAIQWLETNYYQVLTFPIIIVLSFSLACYHHAKHIIERNDFSTVAMALFACWIISVFLISMTTFSLKWISLVAVVWGIILLMCLLPFLTAPLAVKHNRHTCSPA
jgi:hypothetical protein